ncbi:MAG TPA: response regulator [Candidatus Dormibacteraeota bacterium]|nr:response regulator [Candidatus Dormibacteraeota bacterium]
MSPAKRIRSSKRSRLPLDEKLRTRLAELEETLQAIRCGTVDALVINGPKGEQVFTLQGAEHPYRVLVETINEGAATLDAAGTILYSNTRFAEILRVPLERFIGSALYSHVDPSEREKLQSLIEHGREQTAKGEINVGTLEGRSRVVRFSLSPVKNSGLQTICVVATELTELLEANESLKSNEETLRQLSSRLLQLQDDERRHIARDLHDITGQNLAVQSIALSQILNSKTVRLDTDTRKTLAECAALTRQVGEEIRTLSYLLHPPLLDELGLASAVKWYAQGYQLRTGIEVEVDISSDFVRLPPEAEVTLFRVVQESLTNVHRYSSSPRAYVNLGTNGSEVKVQVGDFGKGMSTEVLKSPHGTDAPLGVGIQGMKERMRQLSGRLDITSRPKEGTLVTATLPMSELQATSGTFSPADTWNPSLEVESSHVAPLSARKRILVADDHEVLRHGIRTMLQSETDLEICGEAVNGQDAIAKAGELNPDLVILDINMPGLNGLAAVRQILRRHPKTKVLVFTVHDSDQTVQEIVASGAHGYLSKAKGGQDLVSVIKDLLAGNFSYPHTALRAAE